MSFTINFRMERTSRSCSLCKCTLFFDRYFPPSLLRDMTVPFSNWTTEQVCGWLEDYGLGQYVNLARQWVISGQTLLSATLQEFEKV